MTTKPRKPKASVAKTNYHEWAVIRGSRTCVNCGVLWRQRTNDECKDAKPQSGMIDAKPIAQPQPQPMSDFTAPDVETLAKLSAGTVRLMLRNAKREIDRLRAELEQRPHD